MIAAIIAVSANGVIGNNGKLPWPRIDEDMAFFRKHTKGHAVVMGRKTWDSLPDKPLPSRRNYIVSRSGRRHSDGNIGWFGEDFKQDILDYGYIPDVTKLFIIGGAEIYRQTWDICDKIYLTNVHGEYEGDTKIDMGLVLSEFSLESIEPHKRCTCEIWSRDVRIP